jgi:glucose-6-phosphate 1-dehydrogenase
MSCTFVIFGASGDLTRRKLIPALYRLHRQQRLPAETRIVGCSRSEFTDEQWQHSLAESTVEMTHEPLDAEAWRSFAERIAYVPLDIGRQQDFQQLAKRLQQFESGDAPETRVYYLSTAPKLYPEAVDQLGTAGLADEQRGPRRIVIEKPFGTDQASARKLNDDLHRVFQERQIYRIDHYLGKETVQNLLVLRFANSIFEPIWNRTYVDHVQITVAEAVEVGKRGGYYDHSGVLRDMFQNHLLQLLMITAMEAPVRYEADLVRDEKVKVLRAIRPLQEEDVTRDTLRGQYASYREEPGVAGDSQCATFAILKLLIDNWRWQGVPFYLRSGKAMSCRTTQIVVQFRCPPHMLFSRGQCKHLDANRLVLQIQPAEGIQLHFQTKVPDAGMQMRMTDLDFRFDREFSHSLPDAYQRLLLDVAAGDASLFARSDEVELAWGVIDPIQQAWDRSTVPPLESYPAGEWGPLRATEWMRQQGREWFDVCPVLH